MVTSTRWIALVESYAEQHGMNRSEAIRALVEKALRVDHRKSSAGDQVGDRHS